MTRADEPAFPLIKRLGLEVHPSEMCRCNFVRAADLERVLREAPTVWSDRSDSGEVWSEMGDSRSTHTALLVGIRPIQVDTAEGLLREFVRLTCDEDMGIDRTKEFVMARERARALIESKKEGK